MTNCTWGEIGPLPPVEYISIGIFLVTSGFVTGGLALFGLYVYIRDKALHTPSAIPEIGLLLGDLAVAGLHPFSGYAALMNRWIWGPSGCQLYALAGFIFGNFQLMIIAFIAVDRYIHLCSNYLRRYRTYACYRKVFIMLFVATLVLGLGPLFGWGRYAMTSGKISCTIDWTDKSASYYSYITTAAICVLIAPLSITGMSYSAIWKGLKKTKTIDPLRLHWARMGSLGFTILGCALGTHLAFGIYGVVTLWGFFADPSTIPVGLAASPPNVVKLAGLFNAIFFMAMNPGFCGAAKRVWNGTPCDETPSLSDVMTERTDPRADPTIPFMDNPQNMNQKMGKLERMASRERMLGKTKI